MLNNEYRKQAARDLQMINLQYKNIFEKTVKDMEGLYKNRTIAINSISFVERYAIMLANRPRNFDTKIGNIKMRYVKYQETCKSIQKNMNLELPPEIFNGYRATGIIGGTGIATLGSSAVLAVATTLGTTSTGTAIASLSGAAATNAALAWIGGGALAAGGAGMAAGQTLLKLIGPLGWVITGTSLIESLVTINMSNREIAKKTEESIIAIKKEIARIKKIDIQVLSLNQETKNLSNAIMKRLNIIKKNRKKDYQLFNEDEINELISLFNSTEVLSKLLGRSIDGGK